MINANMREYNYFLYNSDTDAYGQKTLIKDDNGEPVIQGTIKMSIDNTTTAIQDNINYQNAQYIGLTMNKNISDHYVIQYGEEQLKVLYVVPKGRYRQVFLNSI